ncbi:MAG: response regulator transcription factor [Candidatus Omnitrophota bacterium]
MEHEFNGRLIALIDDDPDMRNTVSDYLKGEGFKIRGFGTGRKFFEFLRDTRPDLILLDIMLPDMNGFQICKTLREEERYSAIPIIILSGQDKDMDKVFGLDLGADDYMIKPYSLKELSARIKAVLRRQESRFAEKIMKISDFLILDLKKYQVSVDGRKLEITFTEFRILELLCLNRGQVFTRESILRHLWGDEKIVLDRTIDVHIRHLREKLAPYGSCIEMVRGIGYRMKEDI